MKLREIWCGLTGHVYEEREVQLIAGATSKVGERVVGVHECAICGHTILSRSMFKGVYYKNPEDQERAMSAERRRMYERAINRAKERQSEIDH